MTDIVQPTNGRRSGERELQWLTWAVRAVVLIGIGAANHRLQQQEEQITALREQVAIVKTVQAGHQDLSRKVYELESWKFRVGDDIEDYDQRLKDIERRIEP